MTKELITLNDYVDGYLLAVLDEQESGFTKGQSEFLTKFRDSLAKIPSNKEGQELVKALSSNLLKTVNTLPQDFSLNQKKGFEKALETLSAKIKELFNVDDLEIGTVKQYLRDVPRIYLEGRPKLPDPTELAGAENINELLDEAEVTMKDGIRKQTAVLENHKNNNGKVVIISDLGYTDLNDIGADSLSAMIAGSVQSEKDVTKMIALTKSMIHRVRNSNKGGEDPFKDLFGEKGPDDEGPGF